MKLIIDIPEEMQEQIKDGYVPLGISKYLKNGTPLDDIKAEIENATTLHMGMVGYVEAEKVIELLDNIGKTESEQ